MEDKFALRDIEKIRRKAVAYEIWIVEWHEGKARVGRYKRIRMAVMYEIWIVGWLEGKFGVVVWKNKEMGSYVWNLHSWIMGKISLSFLV